MSPYTHYVINTVVDLGDGKTEAIMDGNITGTFNLMRLVEEIMVYDYPMMVSVNVKRVDLSDADVRQYYNLPNWGDCNLYTFKFTLKTDLELNINGIPLVLVSDVNGERVQKFISDGSKPNISISKKTFY